MGRGVGDGPKGMRVKGATKDGSEPISDSVGVKTVIRCAENDRTVDFEKGLARGVGLFDEAILHRTDSALCCGEYLFKVRVLG